MLILAGLAGACGWIARGLAPLPEATAEPKRAPIVIAAPPVIQVVMAPSAAPEAEAPEVLEAEDTPAAEDAPEAGEDLGALIARAEIESADHNAIAGVITDPRSGEALAGVTVVVTAAGLAREQVTITDEQGAYKVAGLPAGLAKVTLYYGDLASVHDAIAVSSLGVTPMSASLDPEPRPAYLDYEVTIPVPTRTFEAALGEAALGEAALGESYVENTYVIE